MCTVTFIPKRKNSTEFIFTSNRDEASNRPAIPPKVYRENGVELLYPKDKVAGGTWIAASSQKKLICLMNGARKAHQRNEPYRKSRGVVLKDLLTSANFKNAVDDYEFEGIEPFTIIYVEWYEGLRLIQLIWDGDEAELLPLEIKPQIWSASMTYTSEMKKERHQWFESFIAENKVSELTSEEVWQFHHNAGKDDPTNGFVIDRGLLKTTSITQIHQKAKNLKMKYKDLLNQELHEAKL